MNDKPEMSGRRIGFTYSGPRLPYWREEIVNGMRIGLEVQGQMPYSELYIAGMPVFLETSCVDSKEVEVKRTWRERLFTRPWRPRQATKMVTIHVPSENVLMLGNKIIMHPATYEKVKRLIDEQKR